MPTTAVLTFDPTPIKPAIDSPNYPAIARPVKLAASTTFAKGAILAEKSGTNEKQTVTIDATGGTFTMTFGGQTTSATAYNALASVVQTNLAALSTIGSGNVSVTQPKRLFTLTNANGSDGGTFYLKVTYNGEEHTTSALTYDDTAADIDAAIEALPHLTGSADVSVSGSGGGPWTVTFSNSLSGPLELQVVQDSTTDGTVWEGGVVLTEGLHPYVVEFTNDLGKQNVAALTTGAGSLTGGAGTATVATLTAGSAGTVGEYAAYSSTATDGTQYPKCILPVACATDSDGKITYGDVSTGGEHGQKYAATDAWFGGVFEADDVSGLTETILSALGGKMLTGSVYAGGLFRF